MVLFNAIAELLSIWMILGTIVIDTVGLNVWLGWLITFIGFIWIGVVYRVSWKAWMEKFRRVTLRWHRMEVLMMSIAAMAWFVAIIHRTPESIRSPWWVLTSAWLGFPLSIIFIGLRSRDTFTRIVAAFLSVALLSTLLVSIYSFGYGFDIHIHSAALKLLTEHGQIHPRTPYYIGYYALILIVHSLIPFISIALIQQWLPPLIAAFVISGSVICLSRQRATFILLPLLFLFPLSWMSESTPQALALSGTLLASILLIIKAPLRLSILVTLATISIHPLSGIPLTITLIDRLLPTQIAKQLQGILIVTGALLVPILFVILGFFSSHPMPWSIPTHIFSLPLVREFNPWLDIAFTLFWNRWIVIMTLLLFALRTSWKQKTPLFDRNERALLVGSSSAAIGAFLLSGFESFPNVIAYETTDYPTRLFQTALVLSLPVVLPLITDAFETIRSKMRRSVTWVSAPLGVVILVMCLFALYPIDVDGYHVDKGYNMSIHDIRAVEWIKHNAQDVPYIVLANQSVSAAAIESNGFQTYFTVRDPRTNKMESVFYYPVPTGGLLYPFYLQFVYQTPRRSTVIAAMERVGVQRAYVVINTYWKNSAALVRSAQHDANLAYSIDEGTIWIFRYDRNGPTTE